MGRPRKQTAEYFPHYVADSRTKFILEDGWGNDGYAFWFKLLELLCKSDGHYYDCNENGNKRYLTAYAKLDEATVDAIISTLVDAGKIDRELWEQRQIIWCQNLVDNLASLYAKRTVKSPAKPGTVEFSERKTPETTQSDDENPQSKVKESKVEESIGEKREIGAAAPPPSPPSEGTPADVKVVRHKYGDYGWVRLSDDEFARLIADYGEETARHYIHYVDESAEQTGNKNKWKNWNLTVRKAINGKWGGGFTAQKGGNDNGTHRQHNGPSGGFRPSTGFKRPDGWDEE